jgi:hypothetical protein
MKKYTDVPHYVHHQSMNKASDKYKTVKTTFGKYVQTKLE